MIRVVTLSDRNKIIELSRSMGFDEDEIGVVAETLEHYFSEPSISKWFVAENDTGVVGVVYCAPEVMTKGTWNALMLLVHPDAQRQGYGRSLLQHTESELTKEGARLLIVETSSLNVFSPARAFYKKVGYTEEARLREFYAAGEDKIVFTKLLGCKS